MPRVEKPSYNKVLHVIAAAIFSVSAVSFVAYIIAGVITQFSLEPTRMLNDYFWTALSLVAVTALIVASGLYLLFCKKLTEVDSLREENEANKQALKEYQEANEQARIIMAKRSIEEAGE